MTDSVFTPFMCIIERISNARNAVIGFYVTHGFVVNQYIRIHNYPIFGMIPINNMRGKVIAKTQFEVTVDIDTSQFGSFARPVFGNHIQEPCAVPAGSGVDFSVYAPTMILNDCFDNVPS